MQGGAVCIMAAAVPSDHEDTAPRAEGRRAVVEVLDSCAVGEQVARGSFGEVLSATESATGRRMAVKRLHTHT